MTRKVFVYTDYRNALNAQKQRDYRPYLERCVSCGKNHSTQEYGRPCEQCRNREEAESD